MQIKVILHQFWVKKIPPSKFNDMKQTDSSLIIVRNVCLLTSESIMIVYLFFTRSWSAIIGTKQPKVNPRIICFQIFCDFLLKSAFERIFNVMQLILVKIKSHIKWKYLIQKFHDICLSCYFKLLWRFPTLWLYS
jgi:hypothetical protein